MVTPRRRLHKHWKRIYKCSVIVCAGTQYMLRSVRNLVGRSECGFPFFLANAHLYIIACTHWNVNAAHHHSFIGGRGRV